jgi:hypothetical protein
LEIPENESPLSIEANVFLSMPSPQGPVTVHFKILGQGPEVLDDFERLVAEKLAAGYLPEQGRGGGAAPVSGGQAQTSQGAERPTKFQHTDGNTYWINESRKQPGSFFVARKDKASGKYCYLKGPEIPEYVRSAYGDALS